MMFKEGSRLVWSHCGVRSLKSLGNPRDSGTEALEMFGTGWTGLEDLFRICSKGVTSDRSKSEVRSVGCAGWLDLLLILSPISSQGPRPLAQFSWNLMNSSSFSFSSENQF